MGTQGNKDSMGWIQGFKNYFHSIFDIRSDMMSYRELNEMMEENTIIHGSNIATITQGGGRHFPVSYLDMLFWVTSSFFASICWERYGFLLIRRCRRFLARFCFSCSSFTNAISCPPKPQISAQGRRRGCQHGFPDHWIRRKARYTSQPPAHSHRPYRTVPS